MREIKAPRAWYKPLGVMIHPKSVVSINFDTDTVGVYMEIDYKGFHRLRLSDFELMWSTGLPDRKAVEIYDGDLCKDGDGKSLLQIVWTKNHQWGVKVLQGGALSKGLIFPLWHWDNCPQNDNRQLEVIGNIHDNPELLQPQGGGKGE
ncbi:hypothetical protein JOD82_001820 [Paenibacillus sp. 1182]|uniref:YopX family protein n=1 Tax=Paenibacillus sp. 1182 TaxID=2806565 RepID=UPI001AE86BE6|nr:YopX family protein [Paenibacillus sp. 1182]MBP1308800.1 hypothetical protein [Paenibacillus sp. 1182]